MDALSNPSYGVAGSKKAEYCAQHALEGMVHVLVLRGVRAMDALSNRTTA